MKGETQRKRTPQTTQQTTNYCFQNENTFSSPISVDSFVPRWNWLRDVKRLFHYVMDAGGRVMDSTTRRRQNVIFLRRIHFLDLYAMCSLLNRVKNEFCLAVTRTYSVIILSLLTMFIAIHSILSILFRRTGADQVPLLQLHLESLSGLTLMHTTNLVILRTLKWNFAFSTRNHTRRRPRRRTHPWDNAEKDYIDSNAQRLHRTRDIVRCSNLNNLLFSRLFVRSQSGNK